MKLACALAFTLACNSSKPAEEPPNTPYTADCDVLTKKMVLWDDAHGLRSSQVAASVFQQCKAKRLTVGQVGCLLEAKNLTDAKACAVRFD